MSEIKIVKSIDNRIKVILIYGMLVAIINKFI
jgi:hypothetical protein